MSNKTMLNSCYHTLEQMNPAPGEGGAIIAPTPASVVPNAFVGLKANTGAFPSNWPPKSNANLPPPVFVYRTLKDMSCGMRR